MTFSLLELEEPEVSAVYLNPVDYSAHVEPLLGILGIDGAEIIVRDSIPVGWAYLVFKVA